MDHDIIAVFNSAHALLLGDATGGQVFPSKGFVNKRTGSFSNGRALGKGPFMDTVLLKRKHGRSFADPAGGVNRKKNAVFTLKCLFETFKQFSLMRCTEVEVMPSPRPSPTGRRRLKAGFQQGDMR
jgi:hypothetical protein